MKYRVRKLKKGGWTVQRKGWIFWSDVLDSRGHCFIELDSEAQAYDLMTALIFDDLDEEKSGEEGEG